MARQLLFGIIILSLFIGACDGLFGGRGGGGTKGTPCAERDKDRCKILESFEGGRTKHCVWYNDKCYDKPEAAPAIPEGLAKLKVKSVAVGSGFCAIDENDELWCIPKSTYSEDAYILPNASQKMSQVAMASTTFKDVVCGTTMAKKSVCFDKGVEKQGPTTKDVVKTIPAIYSDTVCAFDDKGSLYCQSAEKAFEKGLDAFYVDLKTKAAAAFPNPKILDFLFRGTHYGVSTSRSVAVMFGDNSLWFAYRDDDPLYPHGWRLGAKTLNVPNVKSYSAYEDALCFSEINVNGVSCFDMDYGKPVDIPDDIKNNKISQVATAKDFACAIYEGSGKLECWGAKRVLKNLPTNLTGVKSVAVSKDLICYIDKDDHLGCVGE